MTPNPSPTPPASRPAISMKKLAEEKERAQDASMVLPERKAVRGLAELHAAITEKHTAIAQKIATKLAAKGFEGRHLDDMIYEIAQSVCEKLKPSALKEQDLEYRVANELNTEPMQVQLAVLAVWFDDEVVLQEKLEKDLMIQL